MDTNSSIQATQQKSPLPTWIIIGIGVAFVTLWVSFFRPKLLLQQATEGAGIGQPLPALELQPLTGTTEGVSLENLRGKVVLINYWGPWCGFCVQEFPHLVELWDKNRGNPEFAFVSVSSAGKSREDVPEIKQQTEDFFKSRGSAFPTYVDPDGANRQILASVTDMQGFGYPTTVLLDRGGIIRALWIGYQSGYENQMEQLVSQLLAAKSATSDTAAK
jgi:cytochrome c biogenesis protein CcmG, thiol:disulfide interchange protein DsbE